MRREPMRTEDTWPMEERILDGVSSRSEFRDSTREAMEPTKLPYEDRGAQDDAEGCHRPATAGKRVTLKTAAYAKDMDSLSITLEAKGRDTLGLKGPGRWGRRDTSHVPTSCTTAMSAARPGCDEEAIAKRKRQ